MQPTGLQSPGEFIEALAKGSLVSLDTAIQAREAEIMRMQNRLGLASPGRFDVDGGRF